MSSMSYICEKKDVDEKRKRKAKKCYLLLAPFNEKLALSRPSTGFEIVGLNLARFPACDCEKSWFVDGVVLALFKAIDSCCFRAVFGTCCSTDADAMERFFDCTAFGFTAFGCRAFGCTAFGATAFPAFFKSCWGGRLHNWRRGRFLSCTLGTSARCRTLGFRGQP